MSETTASLSNVPNDVLALALRETQMAADRVKAAQLKLRSVVDKWAEQGVHKKALKDALKFRKVTEGDFSAQISQFLRFMGVEGYPVGQDTLFAGLDLTPLGPEAAAAHREWQARDGGYQYALKAGDRSDNMFKPGTALYVAWDAGWSEGYDTLQAALPEKTELAPTRRERTPPPAAPAAKPEPEWTDQDQVTAESVANAMEGLNNLRPANDEAPADGDDLGFPSVPAFLATPPAPKRGRPPGKKETVVVAPRPRGRPRKAV